MKTMKILAFGFALLSAQLFGQAITGSIRGTVFDQAGALVPRARVAAINIDTGVAQKTETNASGGYLTPALQPGNYRIEVEAEGFNKLTRAPIVVETNRTVTFDLTLSLSSAKTEVTVQATTPLVEEASAVIQYNVNQKAIEELPLPDQSVINVLTLMPGVVGEIGSETTTVTTGYTMPGSAVSMSGSRMGSSQYKADGVGNTSMFFGRISLAFSSDAVQEVAVQQNSYSAEFGRAGGGVVQMTTRSGSNQLRGTLFSFLQNDALNASPYANSYRTKGKQRYWRGGVDAGGPVIIPKIYDGRNRTFFFFGYEPKRQSTDTIAYTKVPTELERQGDFSQSYYDLTKKYPVTIFRQFDFNASGTGLMGTKMVLPANTPFPQWPGNKIPKNLISPTASKLLELIPLPNYPMQMDGSNRAEMRGVTNTDDRILVKLDQVATDRHRISGRIAYVPTRGERYFMGGKDSLVNGTPTDLSIGTNLALGLTSTLSANKVNELRAGFNRSNIQRGANAAQLSKNWFQEYNIPSRVDRGMPKLALDDFEPYASAAGSVEIDNGYEVNDSFTWIRGRHVFKMGGEYQALQQNLRDASALQGTWTFNSSLTGIGSFDTSKYPGIGVSGARTGYSIATLLLGMPSGVSMAADVVPYQYRWKNFGGYFQDDIKVTPRLTVNVGVRYQVEVPRSEKHHNQGYFVNEKAVNAAGRQVVGYLQMTGLGGAPNTIFPTRYNNLEPRIGVAYRLPGNGLGPLKVIRSGYGISHTPTNALFREATPDLSPKAGQLASTGGKNGGWVHLDSNPLVLPAGLPAWPSDGKFTDLQNIATPAYFNQNVAIPYLQHWNFGLGFQFGREFGLEANYVGSKGTNLFGPSARFNTINLDQYLQQYTAGLNMNDQFPNPAGIVDQNGKIVQVSRANLLRPNPLLGSIQDVLSQGYDSHYHSLQLQLRKRYANGLQFNLNYTWSKSMDTVSCEGQFCNDGLGPYGATMPQLFGGDRSLEKSVSSFDTPHVFRLSWNWDLPVGKGKLLLANARVLNHVLGDWRIGGIASLQSNLPLVAQLNADAGWPDDVGRIRPNWTGSPNAVNGDWKEHLNDPVQRYASFLNVAEAFSPTKRFALGNAPRVIPYVRVPGMGGFNLSLIKEVRVNERVRIALRAEMYDALNHPYVKYTQTAAAKIRVYSSLNYQFSDIPPVTASNISTNFADLSTNVSNRTMQVGLKLYF